MLKNPIIKVHFHGVEVQIQHIPDKHMIVNINGTWRQRTVFTIMQANVYIDVPS